MKLRVTRGAGILLLAIWLILTGLDGFVGLPIPNVFMASLAILAGILLLLGSHHPLGGLLRLGGRSRGGRSDGRRRRGAVRRRRDWCARCSCRAVTRQNRTWHPTECAERAKHRQRCRLSLGQNPFARRSDRHRWLADHESPGEGRIHRVEET